jgi:hypothetical protein
LLSGSIPKFVLSVLCLSGSGEVACQIVIYSEGIRIIAQRVKKNLDQDGFRDKSRISRIFGVGTGLTTGLNLNI